MQKKISNYIVEFLIKNKVTDIFGYPGGMVTHFMDSLEFYKDSINNHLCYHEQAASFAACGYAQISGNIGCAYATSGPGATNLITGICQAYFDSIPVIFITGQVNTYESKKGLNVRQKGFQETDIVSIVSPVTKYATQIDNPKEIRFYLEKALHMAKEGRPGPVLLDIPMNVFRTIVEEDELNKYDTNLQYFSTGEKEYNILMKELSLSNRPVILAGAGINISNMRNIFRKIIKKLEIPVVTSMISVDLLSKDNKYNYGFIGAYGNRSANFTIMNSDLIISLGSRLDFRQTGTNLQSFAPNAKIIRFDIDDEELKNKIKETDINLKCDLKIFLEYLDKKTDKTKDFSEWVEICNQYKSKLSLIDINTSNEYIKRISELIDDNAIITTDVGQNQVWVSQSFQNKSDQRIIFSGGLGSMGYSLPSAIGAYYASKKKIYAFCGDGGFQMNIQELQFLFREKIPVKIIVINNFSLGMIRHFQEMYFESNYVQTIQGHGYQTPDFCAIAKAYGIETYSINSIDDIKLLSKIFNNLKPILINVNIEDKTYVYPKLAVNKPIDDQDPLMDRELYNYLKNL